jgi:hypothetical protein
VRGVDGLDIDLPGLAASGTPRGAKSATATRATATAHNAIAIIYNGRPEALCVAPTVAAMPAMATKTVAAAKRFAGVTAVPLVQASVAATEPRGQASPAS